jgi:phage terminase Nu1 subunit (DNA packaging protein)
MMVDMNATAVQTVVAQVVGVSKQAISQMVTEGKLPGDGTNGAMVLAYCERMREMAAGRLGSEIGGLDLVQERAGLAREQRIAQALKNQVARGEYAPVGLLADVLGMASGAVVDRIDQLEGALRKSCPQIDDEVMATVLAVVSAARNEWIRSTARLVDDTLDSMVGEADDLAAAVEAMADEAGA